jgi:hypothetical protein
VSWVSAALHASRPPVSGRTQGYPRSRSNRAALAAEASFGHPQYTTIFRSRGRSSRLASIASSEIAIASRVRRGSICCVVRPRTSTTSGRSPAAISVRNSCTEIRETSGARATRRRHHRHAIYIASVTATAAKACQPRLCATHGGVRRQDQRIHCSAPIQRTSRRPSRRKATAAAER